MLHSKKILIIDDEEDLCLLLKNYFSRKNYEVIVAHSIGEGQALLNTVHPDILFLDNNLPDGIGWEMAPGIAVAYPDTNIILISAFHPVVPVMPGGAAYHVIEKPISMAELDARFADL